MMQKLKEIVVPFQLTQKNQLPLFWNLFAGTGIEKQKQTHQRSVFTWAFVMRILMKWMKCVVSSQLGHLMARWYV